ncbi:MAG: hypothetical protein JJT81_06390 [Rubellimicrobium sp.]|nr:hypothetical protein [Rubellimicrobium sp.]
MAGTSTATQTEDADTAALSAALPLLRTIQIRGLAMIVATLLAMLALIVLVGFGAETQVNVTVIGLMCGIGAILWIHDHVRKDHEAEIMPIVAGTFGLDFVKHPVGFLETIPATIPPRSYRTVLDDGLSGTIAERKWRFAEVKTQSGGKNNRVYFDGAVIAVQAGASLPQFIIARHEDTRGSFWKGRARIDLSQEPLAPHSFGGWLTGFGLWSRQLRDGQFAPIEQLCDDIARSVGRLGHGAELCMIASDGPEIVVAITHKHEMFRIGGLFATRSSVLADIRKVADEVAPVIEVVTAILRAEAAMSSSTT